MADRLWRVSKDKSGRTSCTVALVKGLLRFLSAEMQRKNGEEWEGSSGEQSTRKDREWERLKKRKEVTHSKAFGNSLEFLSPMSHFWPQSIWLTTLSPWVPDWTGSDSGFFSETSTFKGWRVSVVILLCCGSTSGLQRGIPSLFWPRGITWEQAHDHLRDDLPGCLGSGVSALSAPFCMSWGWSYSRLVVRSLVIAVENGFCFGKSCVWAMAVCLTRGRLSASRAGHRPPQLYQRNGPQILGHLFHGHLQTEACTGDTNGGRCSPASCW